MFIAFLDVILSNTYFLLYMKTICHSYRLINTFVQEVKMKMLVNMYHYLSQGKTTRQIKPRKRT